MYSIFSNFRLLKYSIFRRFFLAKIAPIALETISD